MVCNSTCKLPLDKLVFRRAGQLTDLPPENLVRILGKAKQSEEYRAQHWRRETAPEVSAASSKRTEVGIHIVGHCGKVSNCPPRMPQVVPDAPDRALDNPGKMPLSFAELRARMAAKRPKGKERVVVVSGPPSRERNRREVGLSELIERSKGFAIVRTPCFELWRSVSPRDGMSGSEICQNKLPDFSDPGDTGERGERGESSSSKSNPKVS